MTRVLHVVSTLRASPNYVDLVGELVGAGVDVHILLGNEALTPVERDLGAAGAEVARLGRTLHGPASAARAAPVVVGEIRRRRPDVVHGQFFGGSVAAAIATSAPGNRARFLHSRRHSTYHHDHARKAVRLDRWVNGRSDHIIAISPIVEEVLCELEDVDPERVSVICHGIRPERYADVPTVEALRFRRRLGIGRETPLVGFCSRMISGKGCRHIIDAMRQVWQVLPEAHLLWLNARGPMAGELHAELADEHRAHLIEFEPDVTAAYAAMDVFVHVPTHRRAEAFGFVYVEAMAAARPSVFTVSGAVAGIVEDGVHARLVDHDDAAATGAAVLELLGDPAAARRLGEAARLVVAERFTVGRAAKEHASLYDAVAQS